MTLSEKLIALWSHMWKNHVCDAMSQWLYIPKKVSQVLLTLLRPGLHQVAYTFIGELCTVLLNMIYGPALSQTPY